MSGHPAFFPPAYLEIGKASYHSLSRQSAAFMRWLSLCFKRDEGNFSSLNFKQARADHGKEKKNRNFCGMLSRTSSQVALVLIMS